jgi:hypothetical protein
MKTNPSVYIDYLKPNLITFIEHNFFTRWQDVVYVIDFIENYGFKVENEV